MGQTSARLRAPGIRGVLLLSVLALLLSTPARAGEDAGASHDRVLLVSGRVFEGRVLENDAKGVRLDVSSPSGGHGELFFPRSMVKKVEIGVVPGAPPPTSDAVRDAWYLLQNGPHVVGARHLVLRHVRSDGEAGWRLEESVEQFPRGPQVPTVRTQRLETVDLAFHPLEITYREVGDASSDPDGPRRYERILTGPVKDGVWHALVHDGGEPRQQAFPLEPGMRCRLGAREDLLHAKETGLREIAFFDPAVPGVVQARAGYTALHLVDGSGQPYDEFVWEEGGVRLVSRFRSAEVVEESVAKGVVAVPATEAQVDAARKDSDDVASGEDPGLFRLPKAGVAFEVPGTSWQATRVEPAPGVRGWRRIATVESSFHVADARIEWDPQAKADTPDSAEAATRLVQRLHAFCPDLRVVEPRRALDVPGEGDAWRMSFTGTLRGEQVRTVAVVVDRGTGRVLFLIACPEVSWAETSPAIERLIASIRRL